MGDVPRAVRRLYRKLCVRRLKRERGMALFNLDDAQPGQPASGVTYPVHPMMGDVRILDRFQVRCRTHREISTLGLASSTVSKMYRFVTYISAQYDVSSGQYPKNSISYEEMHIV